MKILIQVVRVLVGALFIFSGLVKLNDPMGMSFKLHDYFAPDVLNLGFLDAYTLWLALFVILAEILLGTALIIGHRIGFTLNALLALIVFFTFLTFYSAYFNKVTDCGCFGDAIPLTPWQSFTKDIVLLGLILILFAGKKHLKPWLSPVLQNVKMVSVTLLSLALAWQVLNHLPYIDFRPYAVGKNLTEGIKSAEELGLEPTVYGTLYTLENSKTGERQEVDGTLYVEEKWWEKTDWKIVESLTKSYVVKKGYEPPIHDFVVMLNDEDITSSILEAEHVLLVCIRKPKRADKVGLEKLNALAAEALKQGVTTIGLSAGLKEEVAAWGLNFEVAALDETALKTIMRSDPGLMMLKKGVVVGKWHFNDTPAWTEVAELL